MSVAIVLSPKQLAFILRCSKLELEELNELRELEYHRGLLEREDLDDEYHSQLRSDEEELLADIKELTSLVDVLTVCKKLTFPGES